MKIECTVNELKELIKETTSNAGTFDVEKTPIETMKEALKEVLNQEHDQDLLIHIDSKSPSLIALKELLKKK